MKNWEPHEDEILKRALAEMGPRWRMIAKLLPGRTEAMCRNRRQRMEAASKPDSTSRNRCLVCGELKKGHTCTKRAQLNVVGFQVPSNASPTIQGVARAVVQELAVSPSLASSSGGSPHVPLLSVTPTVAAAPAPVAPLRAPSGTAALPAPAGMPPMVTRSGSSHMGGALPGHSFDLTYVGGEPSFGDDMDVVPVDAAPPMLRRPTASMPLGSFRSFGSLGSFGSFGAQIESATGAETQNAMGLLAEHAAAAQPSPVDEVLARAGKPPPRPSDSVLQALGGPAAAALLQQEQVELLERQRGASGATESGATDATTACPVGSPDRAEISSAQLRTMAAMAAAMNAAPPAADDDLAPSRDLSGIDMAVLAEEAAA